MKKILTTCCALCVCMCNAYADKQITLKCGASFREIPQAQCFDDARTKTINGVVYRYRIYTTWIGRSGLFENAAGLGSGDKPIGLVIEKAEFPSSIESVTVPSTIDRLPIVVIGNECFRQCSRLKSVSLPKTVISIEGGAFEDCISLETITLPPRIVNIGGAAFKGCRKLKTKFVFNNEVDVGDEAFYGCREITSIHFRKGINSFQAPHRTRRNDINEIGAGTFADCRKLCDFEIPPNTRTIGTSTTGFVGSFSNCCALTRITLPKSLECLGRYAFAGCTALTEIEIPPRTERVSDGTFSGCMALKTVKLPSSLKEIPSEMFAGCASLEAIKIPNSVTEIGESAFRGCSQLSDVNVPHHVKKIGLHAFESCTSLRTIDLPTSLNEISVYLFRGCTGLETIKLPASVTKLNMGAFEGCSRLSSIEMPGVKEICGSAFRGCRSLKTLKIHEGCKCWNDAFFEFDGLQELDIPTDFVRLGNDKSLDFRKSFPHGTNIVCVNIRGALKSIVGFKGCSKLESVTIPEGTESIVDEAFADCTALKTLRLPSTIKDIGACAFYGCTALASMNIPQNTSMIGESAFARCSSLNTIELPSGQCFIARRAFMDCTSLENIKLSQLKGNDNIGEELFKGCSKLNTVVIPNGLKEIDRSAFEGCLALSQINLPDSVEYFGDKAFKDCASLRTIRIPTGARNVENAFAGTPIQEKFDAARTEQKQKELERERDAKKKEDAERAERNRRQEAFEKKQRDAEKKRETDIEKLNERMAKINLEIEEKTNRASGGFGTALWMILIAAGFAGGIFVYAKKTGCAYVEAAKQIGEKIRTSFRGVRVSRNEQGREPFSRESYVEENHNQNMTIRCPHCGAEYEVDESVLGVNCQCSVCNNDFIARDVSSGSNGIE